jgi:hypothetical protein
MRKLLFGTILFVVTAVVPVPAMAQVNVSIGIALPPPVAFVAPPDVIVLPDTNDVYVVPGINIDLFFWDGWWWRPWEGRWYRSRYYDRGWGYYNGVPRFYFDVDPGWRRYYRDRDWHGYRWNYEPIPYGRLHKNWKTWRSDRHWERQRTWDVQRYHPRPQQQRQELRRQREEQYHRRPEVQRHQQQMQEQQRHHQGPQHQGESHHKGSQGKPGRGD